MNHIHRRYEISDKTWELLEAHLPGRKGTWGGNARDNRQFINAVFWILRTGAPWRDLPPDYGHWNTTHRRFCRWRDRGVWESLLEILLNEPAFEWLMMDVSHLKAFSPGANITGSKNVTGGKQESDRTKGGSAPKYAWPWMRMVCQSEWLLQMVPQLIIRRLLFDRKT